jgi:hypothetical protein
MNLKQLFGLEPTGSTIYLEHGRLEDVLALIQLLALDEHAHRSEKGLHDDLQGPPRSKAEWTQVAAEHPEFFRVRGEGIHRVSLLSRHVTPKVDDDTKPLSPEFTLQLLTAAIELHDRQVKRAETWSHLIPVWAAVVASIAAIIVSVVGAIAAIVAATLKH